MANLLGQLRDFFRAPKLDEALRELAPKQVTPQTRTSWVFDSHVMTEAAGARSSSKNPQAVSLAWDEDRWNIDSSAKNSWTGLTHRERKETLLSIFLANPWASNCIDTIALYIISGGLTIEPRVPNPDKSQRTKIEQLLLRINDDWDFNQYVYDQITDEMIFGETFTEYTMAGGMPYQLFAIDCLTMDTEHDRYGRALRYKQQLTSTSEVNYLKTDNIIRWWNPHKRAKVDPFSPLERVQDAILLDKKMVNWQTTFFQKGAKFPYSIEFQGDRDEADRFLTWFKQNFTGEKNAHLPPVTYNGAKLNPTGKGSIDIDFDRGLDRNQTIILSAFHVPPSIACIAESGNRLTDMSDGQRKILQYIACDPRRHQFFEKFNFRLIRPYFGEDYYVSTRYADFRSDEDLAKVADMRIRNGSALIDEIRQEMGKEAYPDGTGNVAVIVTAKEITPVPRLKDLEDEQRQTAKQSLDAGDLNNQMLATKVEQAKNPPPPPPMMGQQPPQQGATNDKNSQGVPAQNKQTPKGKPKTQEEMDGNLEEQIFSGSHQSGVSDVSGNSTRSTVHLPIASLTQEYNQNHGAHGRFDFGSADTGGGSNFNSMSIPQKEAFLAQNGGDKWEAGLSAQEKHSVEAYTHGKYIDMNGALRRGQYGLADPERTDGFNHYAAQALLRGSAPTDMTVLRQVGSEMYGPFAANVGKHFVDKGFCSTTINSNATAEFSDYGSVSLHIRLPKGTPGAYVVNLTPQSVKDNCEWTLPPNAKFKIVQAWSDAGGNNHVALEYAGQHSWG